MDKGVKQTSEGSTPQQNRLKQILILTESHGNEKSNGQLGEGPI